MVEGRKVALGTARFMQEVGVATDVLATKATELRQNGATVIFIAIDGKLAGIAAIADPIKSTTPEALRDLRAEGIEIVMLTGDNRTTAMAIARQLGIEKVEAEVLPDQKAEIVLRYRNMGRVVAMAGDGVNDAPALARKNLHHGRHPHMPHLRSSYGYDEPEILLPTCRRFCPMSADPGQRNVDHNASQQGRASSVTCSSRRKSCSSLRSSNGRMLRLEQQC